MSAYLSLLENIEKAKLKAGREKEKIQLVVVSKGRSIEEIKKVYGLGARDFGENRILEALQKIPLEPRDIQWHFIGTLQKNKVNKAIGQFRLIHSVDSFELAEKISNASELASITSSILLQVNTSGEPSKQGLSRELWLSKMEKLYALKNIEIKGLMTIAPLTEDKKMIHATFNRLRQFRDELKLSLLSMGMSHDYEIAIEEGSNLLRIGTAIFK